MKYTYQNKEISVFPMLDSNNNVRREMVKDAHDNDIQSLSKFRYVQTDNSTGKISSFDILVDFDVNLYNNDPDYREALYSKLLSPNRINKINNQYEGYAGKLLKNPNTGKYEKFIDSDLIQALKVQKALKQQQDQKNQESDFQSTRENFTKGIHIKTSHAEPLNPDMYKQMYGKSLDSDNER